MVVAGRDAGEVLETAEHPFNGFLADDKFCLTRAAQLRLSWRRSLFSVAVRHPVPGEITHRGEHVARAPIARPAQRRVNRD